MGNRTNRKYPLEGIAGLLLMIVFILSLLPPVIGLFLLSISIYLIGRQISVFLENRKRFLLSSYAKIIIAPLISSFIVYVIVFSILFSSARDLISLEDALIYSFLILTFIFSSIYLYAHSERYHVDEAVTNATKKFSISFFPFILALFSSTQPSLVDLTYAFSFAAVVMVLTSPFYYYLENPKEGISKLAGFMVSNRDFYLVSFALVGFLYGLYLQNTINTYKDSLLVIIFIIGVGVVIRILFQGYNSLSSMTQRNSFQVYAKFNKKESVTEIGRISKVAESIKDFEANGRKEKILINLSTYLSETGFSNDDVERFLKPIVEYKLPIKFSLDIESSRQRIRREIEKRRKIMDGILKNIERSEKLYEK
ncbi:hypothetical protein ACNF40_01835 [Cuniculiplasma sp. SKW4]|uniref:hypothetical protein n=1 Tax=Cuniculiplasma sp. SKW4 TaxID=3400171 RepID=UPI003FD335E8